MTTSPFVTNTKMAAIVKANGKPQRRRRAWLADHSTEVTMSAAAKKFGVQPATIETDCRELGVKCKAREMGSNAHKVRAKRLPICAEIRHLAYIRSWGPAFIEEEQI